MAVAVKHGAGAAGRVEARFEALVLDFLAYLEFERGLSRNTLEAYRSDLLQFGAFLAERGVGARPRPSAADVADFLAELATGNGQPAGSPATINRKTACLRSFYRHLRREELVDARSDGDAQRARARAASLPRVLTRGEVEAAAREPRAAPIRSSCATGRCSR